MQDTLERPDISKMIELCDVVESPRDDAWEDRYLALRRLSQVAPGWCRALLGWVEHLERAASLWESRSKYWQRQAMEWRALAEEATTP